MKILIFTAGFFPGKNYGGPPVSVDNFCTLMKDFDCFIVTRNHDLGTKESYKDINKGWNNRGNCKVKYLADNDYNYDGFNKIIEEINPDLIYLQGLFQSCVFPCLRLAKKYHIKVLLAPRGELNKGAFKKKYKKIPYIAILKLLGLLQGIHYQSTSKEETDSIKKYLQGKDKEIHLLENIPSIPKKKYIHSKKVEGNAKFVFLSRIHPKKNLLYAINLFSEVCGNVSFDIYGPIEDENYWEKCKKAITNLPKNIKVNYIGETKHEEVHNVFSQYDCFLFPTLSENYGHVIAEALLSSTLVLISDQTPWSDINKFEAGWSIGLQNKNLFREKISEIINMDENDMSGYVFNINKYLSNKIDINQLRQMHNKVIYGIINGEVQQ